MVFPRSAQAEIMDDVSILGDRLDSALRELSVINRWLGGFSTSRSGVAFMNKDHTTPSAMTILDVGAGGSDLQSAIRKPLPGAYVTSLDLNFGACQYSRRTHPGLGAVQGSVFALPFKDDSFDLVHASLFLHHFTENELQKILIALYAVARHGIVINDLRRSVFSYLGIMLLTHLFSRSRMVINDAPLSVRKGFSRSDLRRLLVPFPSSSVTVRRTWAFRWLVCIRKEA